MSIDRSQFHSTREVCRDQARYGRLGCKLNKACPYLHIDDRNALRVIKICNANRNCQDKECNKFHSNGRKFFKKRGGVHSRRKQEPSNPVVQAPSPATSSAVSKAHHVFFGNSVPQAQSPKVIHINPVDIDSAIMEATTIDAIERLISAEN